MGLSGVTDRLTASEAARQPKSLAVVAFYDGWAQQQGMKPASYDRRLTRHEAESWRDGWRDAIAQDAEQKRLGLHHHSPLAPPRTPTTEGTPSP